MEKHQLSKSTFIRGVQCLKSLYLYKNRYFLRDRLSAEQLAKFKRGTDVGIFAQNLFPGGVDCKPKSPSQYRKSVEKTADIIANNTADVIYEAAFQFDGVLILLDILVKNGTTWDAYEIKSSLKISETYALDAALQYYVLTNSGVDIERFFLVHLNPEYVRGESLVINDLFKFVDVTESAREKTELIEKQIAAEKEAIALKSSPKIDIGAHCRNPYPCDFIGHCWKQVPAKSVFDLAAWNDEEKFDLYNKGIIKIDDVSGDWVNSHKKQLEILSYKSGKDHFDIQAYKNFTMNINPDCCFISFLGHKQAIPVWEGYLPYSSIPVALGVKDHENGNQYIFINQDNSMQPDDGIIRFLENHLTNYKHLLIYDGEQLRALLTEMIMRNPANKDLLNELSEKIIDLKEIFSEYIFFSAKTGNDFSLSNIGKKIVDCASASKISKEVEIEAINVFLKISKKPLEEQQKKFIENSLLTTARIFGYFESLIKIQR